jgi:hypothetical protein
MQPEPFKCGGGVRRFAATAGNVDRLFDLHHSTRLEHLEAAFAALGRRLMIGVEKTA